MPSKPAQPAALHWWVLILLALSACINYVDRSNLGIAARNLETDLKFSPQALGLLLGAFFWTYALCQLVTAKLVDRFNVNWVYAIGYFVWSGATAVTGAVSSFWLLFGLRLLLGAGESLAYPAYSKIIASNFDESLRGTANAMIDAATKLGPAIGILLGVKLVTLLTWRGMFYAIGGVSLLWLVPWMMVAPRLRGGSQSNSSGLAPGPGYREILASRAMWGTTIGLFGANYTWYILLTWLPYYFERERHFTHDRLAWFGSIPFWSVATSSMLAGLMADRLIRRGLPAPRVRQTTVTVGLLGCCIPLLLAVLSHSPQTAVLLISVACVSFGLFSSNHWAFTQTLAGPRGAAKWTGVENCMGNLAGVAAPYVTGRILQETESFIAAFGVACVVLLVGACGFWFVVGKTERVIWSSERAPIPTALVD